jgi:oligopeptide transport system ATP-binding protein
MYLGKIVELAETDELYENPLHPYTQSLLSAVPVPDPVVEEQRHRIILTGDVPNPASPPPGCNFSTRCPVHFDLCHQPPDPPLIEVSPGHLVACHRVT